MDMDLHSHLTADEMKNRRKIEQKMEKINEDRGTLIGSQLSPRYMSRRSHVVYSLWREDFV
jgi:hypothetical protein